MARERDVDHRRLFEMREIASDSLCAVRYFAEHGIRAPVNRILGSRLRHGGGQCPQWMRLR